MTGVQTCALPISQLTEAIMFIIPIVRFSITFLMTPKQRLKATGEDMDRSDVWPLVMFADMLEARMIGLVNLSVDNERHGHVKFEYGYSIIVQ